jgi:hypothetical protein
LWAKRSQVLARFARLNRHQPQRSPQSCIGEPYANCEKSRVAVFSKAERPRHIFLSAIKGFLNTKASIARGGNPSLVIENDRKIIAANVARLSGHQNI